VRALEFDIQARTPNGAEYDPLVVVEGVESWPAEPDYSQLEDGGRLKDEACDFEAHWDLRRTEEKTLRVTKDFDFVVLAVGGGAVAFLTKELAERHQRWRLMLDNLKTVATQAFQLWLKEDIHSLGWSQPPATVSAFVKPFDTWADMSQVVPQESWPTMPRAAAYFCNALPDGNGDIADKSYALERSEQVKRNAIAFLGRDIGLLMPGLMDESGAFRWDTLCTYDPSTERLVGESRFSSQYWAANVNPSDRYVQAMPGTLAHRISPLDNSIDNFTIAGDWTDCGFNEGCVEAAIMSGRLAAHALSGRPALTEIIGYDHP
jgi:uncharacterized protein with NAD-binding domain and iron-sulfur cluster